MRAKIETKEAVEATPFLDLREGRYFAAMWYVELPDNIGNMLAALWRDPEEKDFHLDYRFRYYKNDKIFDSDDERSTYRGTFTGLSEEKAIAQAGLVFGLMAEFGGGRRGKVAHMKTLILRSSDPWFITEQMAKEKFVHVKILGKEGDA